VRDALRAKGITTIELEPGRSGQFDITIDGELKYSRYRTGSFPSDAEVERLVHT